MTLDSNHRAFIDDHATSTQIERLGELEACLRRNNESLGDGATRTRQAREEREYLLGTVSKTYREGVVRGLDDEQLLNQNDIFQKAHRKALQHGEYEAAVTYEAIHKAIYEEGSARGLTLMDSGQKQRASFPSVNPVPPS